MSQLSSILRDTTDNGIDAGKDGAPPSVCHSFVTDGRIQFLGDCTHALVNQAVDLPAWPRGRIES